MNEALNGPAEIPTIDIARWLARINVARTAIDSIRSTKLIYDGQGDSSQPAWELAQASSSMEQAMESVVFEEEILRGLRGNIPMPHRLDVVRGVESLCEASDDLPLDVSDRSDAIRRKAAQVGLLRFGLLVEVDDQIIIPPAAYASLAYYRADIRNPYDRQLFERECEINEALKYLQIFKPREFDATYKDDTVRRITAYRFIAQASQSSLEGLGYSNAHAGWWTELYRDFDRIDQATSGNL